ncbi:MAG: DUF2752 domain-containing protein [bacterium]|nr:DUF2752 domain-containing protein [bacterium]
MRFVRLETDRRGLPAGALFGIVLLLGAGISALWFRFGLPRPVCYFREWTGVPCPTCGSTRMVEAVLHGDFTAAAGLNPLMFCGFALLAVWASVVSLRYAIGRPALRLVLEPRERTVLRMLALLSIAGGWIYLIWRGI